MADYAGEVEGRQCGIGRSSVFGWLGHAEGNNERRDSMPGTHGQREPVGGSSGVVHPDNAEFSGLEGHTRNEYNRDQPGWIDQGADRPVAETGGTGNEGMGNAESRGCGELRDASQPGSSGHVERPSWSGFDIVLCRDTDEHGRPKARRIESGTFPLADGVSGRVELLRGYGNAIVPELAAEFIQAYLETKV
jgi:DNA (cytosine-5)-methyltransferase 1